jgi:hypothetical protein
MAARSFVPSSGMWWGARSLMVATVIGSAGVAELIFLAAWMRSVWFGALSAFILMNCWGGLLQAQALSRLAKLPAHDGFACPSCKASPPVGAFWRCGHCGKPFDSFRTRVVCPNCGSQFPVKKCVHCGDAHPMSEWVVSALVYSTL